MRFLLVLFLCFGLYGQGPAKDQTYSSLRLYQGAWQVLRKDVPSGAKPDKLINACALLGQFFACAQNVNGEAGGLVVFIPKGSLGHFKAQTIMPDGRATGLTDLQINGDVWTYSSRRDEGGATTFYRTLNKFTGKDHIHFESAHSSNNKDWTTEASGDETRIAVAR